MGAPQPMKGAPGGGVRRTEVFREREASRFPSAAGQRHYSMALHSALLTPAPLLTSKSPAVSSIFRRSWIYSKQWVSEQPPPPPPFPPRRPPHLKAPCRQLRLEAVMDVQQVVGIGAGVVHHLGAEGAHPPVGQLVPLVSLNGGGEGERGGGFGSGGVETNMTEALLNPFC